MSSTNNTWCIAFTFCDEEKNGFITLGAVSWENPLDWEKTWADIPESLLGWDDAAKVCVDKIDEEGNCTDEKPVSATFVELILGKSMKKLIEKGREQTCFTIKEWMEKHPEQAKEFASRRKLILGN